MIEQDGDRSNGNKTTQINTYKRNIISIDHLPYLMDYAGVDFSPFHLFSINTSAITKTFQTIQQCNPSYVNHMERIYVYIDGNELIKRNMFTFILGSLLPNSSTCWLCFQTFFFSYFNLISFIYNRGDESRNKLWNVNLYIYVFFYLSIL